MAATVAAPATTMSMMARVDRLDLLLGYLEEMHQHQHQHQHQHRGSTTATSSCSSPASTAHTAGDGDASSGSAASTPRGSRSWSSCRSAKEALQEAQAKGSLVDRIALLEDRLLRMQDDITPAAADSPTMMSMGKAAVHDHDDGRRKKKVKGLKSLVKSCVRGNLSTKD